MLLSAERDVSKSFQNVDISVHIHLALTRSLSNVQKLIRCSEIPHGPVPPGLCGDHLKQIGRIIPQFAQECVCCFVVLPRGIIMSSCPCSLY